MAFIDMCLRKIDSRTVRHMPYYKYLSARRVDVLSSLKIRYSQVSALNDPFEGFPAVVSPDGNEKSAEAFQSKLRIINETTFGILSLSKTPNNILMWSHYADSHRGFLLEFDSKHEFFFQGTQDVRYSRNRPKLIARTGDHSTDIFYTKSLDWKYEQEVRKSLPLHNQIYPLSNGHSIIAADVHAVENPELLHLFDIPRDAITGVILGWKSSAILLCQIQAALEKNGMGEVMLMRAQPCKKEYRMRIFPLNGP